MLDFHAIAYDLLNRVSLPGWGDSVTEALEEALADAYQAGQTDALQRARTACEDVQDRWVTQDGYQEGADAAGDCAEAVRRLLQPGEPNANL